MWTAGPTTRTPRPFFKLRAHSLDVLPSGLVFLDGDGPADPLVARERRYVFPRVESRGVGSERLTEISREAMRDSAGDANGHRLLVSDTGPSSFVQVFSSGGRAWAFLLNYRVGRKCDAHSSGSSPPGGSRFR